MSKALPARIHPLRLAHHGETLAGSVLPAQMPRLAELLHEGGGRAEFELRFGHDDNGQACVLGDIDARLMVLCQRCLEAMEIHVQREIRLALVRGDDEAALLPAEYEPMVLDEQPVLLAGLLEDELILAMPDFSRHGSGECEMPSGADALSAPEREEQVREGRQDDTAGQAGKDNPFSVLESIKSRKKP